MIGKLIAMSCHCSRSGGLNDVSEISGAELQSDVKEVLMRFLVVVSDDVGVVIRFLEDGDLSHAESDNLVAVV